LGYFGHDASAAIVVDGQIVACAAEERFTRVKYGLNLTGNTLWPKKAMQFCLDQAGVTLKDVDTVAHYCDFTEESVRRRFELVSVHLAETDAARLKRSYQRVYTGMLCQKAVAARLRDLSDNGYPPILPVPHHLAHAASAFYVSGFRESLILTLDGAGEVESSLLAIGRGRDIKPLERSFLPASLGVLYQIITVFLGFHSLGDEYKVMGLASFGDPYRYRDFFDSLIRPERGLRYGMHTLADRGLRERIVQKLGSPRSPDGKMEQHHADIAASLQEALERTVVSLLTRVRREKGISRLCLAGGVALNCAMNGAIARSGLFEEIFVQPASGDEGCSLGAALVACRKAESIPEDGFPAWEHAYLGPEFTEEQMASELSSFGESLSFRREEEITRKAAQELASGKVLGWFQGRMEFGPRALGNRSILADPREPRMKDLINEKVKRREPFRPFAPAVLEERASDYFDMGMLDCSPFMLFTFPVREAVKSRIPAVTHVDGTARVQTVSRKVNPLFWDLIEATGRRTGIPMVLNTSFNVRNEPIVCTPADAIRCFLSTEIDALVMGPFYIEKRV
jgi:carbamoyltransferase